MNGTLPEAFANRMRQQLGDELPAFLHTLEEAPVRGIRLNPMKQTEAVKRYLGAGRIPWTDDGYYLENGSDAGNSILHEAGAFYIQEPGAMIPAAVLNARPGEIILDLCAAPGGKRGTAGLQRTGTETGADPQRKH